MNRLIFFIRWDIALQFRYGIYYATGFVVVFYIAVLFSLGRRIAAFFLPIILFVDLAIIGFYFMGALVLFEKNESTIDGLIVSPLRIREYFAARIITFLILSVVASIAVVFIAWGIPENPLLMVAGIVVSSILYTLFGFIAIARYRSVSTYLMPSILYLSLSQLPIIDYAGLIGDSTLWHLAFFIFPTQGPLVLLKGSFAEIPWYDLLLSTGLSAVWIIVFILLAKHAFVKYIIRGEGIK